MRGETSLWPNQKSSWNKDDSWNRSFGTQHFRMLSDECHSVASDTEQPCDPQENDCLQHPHRCEHCIQLPSNPYKFALHRHESTINTFQKEYLQTTNHNISDVRKIRFQVLLHFLRVHRVVHLGKHRESFLCIWSLNQGLKNIHYNSMSPNIPKPVCWSFSGYCSVITQGRWRAREHFSKKPVVLISSSIPKMAFVKAPWTSQTKRAVLEVRSRENILIKEQSGLQLPYKIALILGLGSHQFRVKD